MRGTAISRSGALRADKIVVQKMPAIISRQDTFSNKLGHGFPPHEPPDGDGSHKVFRKVISTKYYEESSGEKTCQFTNARRSKDQSYNDTHCDAMERPELGGRMHSTGDNGVALGAPARNFVPRDEARADVGEDART